jgi:hypothetical protein
MKENKKKKNIFVEDEIENGEFDLDYDPQNDIYIKSKNETDIDPENILMKKFKNENNQLEYNSSEELDVPGSELDDAQENIGSEDEENNYYSIGLDNHNDLEDNKEE